MRIISGTARGRTISGPGQKSGKGSIRPTSDKVRESIFNILGPRAIADNVLDLYAGTGALGIEALSRGSLFGTFVDHDRKAIGLIQKNLAVCGFAETSAVYLRDIERGLGFLRKIAPPPGYDLVFVDPPYRTGLTVELLLELCKRQLIAAAGLVVVEDAGGVELPEEIKDLQRIDFRRYGDTSLWMYQNKITD